ncbi:MAG TPA: ABC transporter permease [Symbiobacteriaceae bacterium]|nr:ABC transporter permease [Symbiobacteriaceae bacterium]
MGTKKKWHRGLAAFAAALSLLILWQVVSLFLPPYLLPGVPKTMARLVKMAAQPEFREGLQASLFRLAVGYGSAVALGAVLGLLGGLSRTFGAYLRQLIAILQSIPPITWVPFLIILFGFGNIPVISVVAIASFFPMALSTLNATEGVGRTHVELARVLGASRGQLLTKVYAPEALPAIVTGAQVAFGNAWRSLIAGEMVGGASRGLGWSISYAGEVADMAGVLVGILVIGATASLIDHVLLEQLKRRLLHWRNTEGEAA